MRGNVDVWTSAMFLIELSVRRRCYANRITEAPKYAPVEFSWSSRLQKSHCTSEFSIYCSEAIATSK